MTTLHLDWETRSRKDLKVVGLDNYAKDPSTCGLMLGYAFDNDDVEQWFPHEGPMPKFLKEAIVRDDSLILMAHNAPFERAIFAHTYRMPTPATRWRDTMVMAYYCGLAGDLDTVGEIVGLSDDTKKVKEGKRLIQTFCKPRKTTKAKPWEFNDWNTEPEKWLDFCHYNQFDVKAERGVHQRLAKFDLPPWEWQMWALDQKINDAGFPVDRAFVEAAQRMSARHAAELMEELRDLTGLKNPNSGPQFREWARENGFPFGDLRKPTVERALKNHKDEMSEDLVRALELRSVATMTSLSKLDTIGSVTNERDDRLRYAHQFMGAARTGRWAGRKVQTQNLKRPLKSQEEHLEEITELIREEDYDTLAEKFGHVRKTLAGCIRSSFRAPEGKRLTVADLSAIEDVCVGWLSRCETILNDHRTGRDPYLSFGVHMFGRPYETLTKAERTWAKPGRLGCCYRLSAGEEVVNKNGDIEKTGLWGYAASMGIDMTQEQCKLAVRAYRETYVEVVQFWYDLENAAMEALRTRCAVRVGYLVIDYKAPFMRIRLPSGRFLHYLRPRIEKKKIQYKNVDELTGETVIKTVIKDTITYEGQDQKSNRWTRLQTHGGKLCENVTQAVARDVLCMGLIRADKMGFEIVGHVHDEIITLTDDDDFLELSDLISCMTKPIKWAPGLPLKAAGYVGRFYKKD